MTETDGVRLLLPAWYDVLWTLVTLVVGLAPLVAVVWVVTRLVRGPAALGPSQAARAARRHAIAVSTLSWLALVATLVVGLGVVAAQPVTLTQGLSYGLVPGLAGTALATVQVVGELTWPRPVGTVRRAPLVRRTVADVAPAGLRRLLLGWAAALVVVLVVAGTVSADGRSIRRAFEGGSAGAGPFPGWFYGAPLLVATVLVLLVTEAALRLITRRPAVSDTAAEWDMGLRRTSARRLIRGAQLVLAWTLSGVLLVAGMALRNVGTGARIGDLPTGSTVHVVGGVVTLVLGLAVGVVGLLVAVLPTHTAAPGPGAPGTGDAGSEGTAAATGGTRGTRGTSSVSELPR